MKIVFVVRSLETGGAERQLVTLASGLKRRGFDVLVIVFYGSGSLETVLSKEGISVIDLDKKGRWDFFGFFAELVKRLRAIKPDMLYCCLSAANVCAVMTRPFIERKVLVVFRIAASYVDMSQYDFYTRLSYWTEARVSHFANLVIVNSHAGFEFAKKRGFRPERMVLLPNGFDTSYFRHDAEGRVRLRRLWRVEDDAPLIGLVARLDPIKDHRMFLDAASLLAKRRGDVRFVCVGNGDSAYRHSLQESAASLGLKDRLIWEDGMRDMPAVYSALDIATLSSYGEGFPNVVGEAMACGTPCVVTNVGDCAWIVGETGKVVEARQPEAMMEGWQEMLARVSKEGDRLGRLARERIARRFSVERLVGDTAERLECLFEETRAVSERGQM